MLGLRVNQLDYLYASSPSAGFRVSSTLLSFMLLCWVYFMLKHVFYRASDWTNIFVRPLIWIVQK